jgi:hypothetical protein
VTLSLCSTADAAIDDPLLCVAELNLEQAAKRFAISKPKTCACRGAATGTLCREYLEEPNAHLRAAILNSPIVTLADAFAALAVLENTLGSDVELERHLFSCFHGYLSAA